MYKRLGSERLKTGEPMEVGVVLAPDAAWLPRVAPFLGHKREETREQIRRSLEAPLDRLQTRYYVGHAGDRVISQVMIAGGGGVGILGHVFTHRDERRKGACQAILGHVMADCARAGFRVLCLGTAFESPAYWIYHSAGFRPVAPECGWMKWLAHPDAEAELFRPGATTVRELGWEDWAGFELLGLQPVDPGEELPRSPTLGLKGQGSLEGPFVSFQLRRERQPEIQARTLVSESGATAGWAIVSPDPRWFGDVWLLELHAHPAFLDRLPELLGALDLPQAPVTASLAGPEGLKARALAGAGFRPSARLPGWFLYEAERRELTLWTHFG